MECPLLRTRTTHCLPLSSSLAVTCGPRAKIICFKCGDFVTHPVFTQEKERIDLSQELPWMGWKEHSLQRSFDPLRFMRIPDQGIFWRGMFATYPPLVPQEHVESGRLCRWRQCLFHGKVTEIPQAASDQAKDFVRRQKEKGRGMSKRNPLFNSIRCAKPPHNPCLVPSRVQIYTSYQRPWACTTSETRVL